MGIRRITLKAALRSDGPRKYERQGRGSVVDEGEPRIRELLTAWPTMPATVIAERIGWGHSSRVLSARVAELRPVFVPVDPFPGSGSRPGRSCSAIFWFLPITVPVGFGQTGVRRNWRC